MQVLTSASCLNLIATYQDGIKAKNLRVQPDVAAQAGHRNFLTYESVYSATPQAFSRTFAGKDPASITHYLIESDIPSDFIAGDEACRNGHTDIMSDILKRAVANPGWHPFSFRGIIHAVQGGHLLILERLCGHMEHTYGLDWSPLLPQMLTEAAKHGQEAVMDWLMVRAAEQGDVPWEIQFIALLYHIRRCGESQGDLSEPSHSHRARAIIILLRNPTLLVQSKATRAVDICAAVGDLPLLRVLFAYCGRESHCALDHAARAGHLAVVKFLTGVDVDVDVDEGVGAVAGTPAPVQPHEDQNQGPSQGRYTIHASNRAITEAARANHLPVVQYLATNRFEGCDNRTFDIVAAAGHVSVLVYLEEHLNDLFRNIVVTTDAMDEAAGSMSMYHA